MTFQPENKTVEFPFGTLPYDGHGQPMSFLDVAENYGIFLDHACGGVSACTTCHIHLKEGAKGVSEPEDLELDRLELSPGLQLNSRLGCHVRHRKNPAPTSPKSPPGIRTTSRKANPPPWLRSNLLAHTSSLLALQNPYTPALGTLLKLS